MGSRGRKGGSTIESALVLLVFLVILFGIGDFAQIFLMHDMLIERVRAAARAGAVQGYSDEQIVNMVMYGSPSPRTGPGFFGMTAASVQVSRTGSSADARISVAVSGLVYHSISPLMAGRLNNLPVRVVISSEAP